MSALRWFAGLAASLAAHVIAGVVLLRALEPQPVPQQPMPETQLDVTAYTLERSEARVALPDPDPATQERASGDRLATGAIPSSRARPTAPKVTRTAPMPPEANTRAPADATSDALAPTAPPALRLTETADPATALPATAAPAVQPLSADNAAPPKLAAQNPDIVTVTPAAASAVATQAAQSIASAPLNPAQAPATAPAVQTLSAGAPAPPKLAAQNPETLTAKPTAPSAVAAQAVRPAAQTLNQARPPVRVAALAQPALASVRPTVTDAMPLAELAPRPTETPATKPQPVSADAATPPAVRASAAALPAVPASPSRPAATPAVAAIPKPSPTAESVPDPRPAVGAPPPTSAAVQAAPRSTPAVAAHTDAAAIRAALAFPAGEDGAVDPVSFAAFQSFMQPGDLSAGTDPVRDRVAGVLAQVPCSRLQVSFDPETTTLVVNGHVPEDDLRGTVVAALQEQMGTSIKVSDNMLILPRPQCGALAGIAAVGLAQSTDQFTNPLVIGEDTHARVFRFTEGQLLSLDMTAPDYDAVIYLDYFDADGNVLHLEPNEYAPLRRATAKTAQQIGARRAGDAGLKLVIGPPYGQEIAVAFAASHPLYDGLRPIQEPAGPYLDWLRERVTEARAAHPEFKGEWVYFFVSTSRG